MYDGRFHLCGRSEEFYMPMSSLAIAQICPVKAGRLTRRSRDNRSVLAIDMPWF